LLSSSVISPDKQEQEQQQVSAVATATATATTLPSSSSSSYQVIGWESNSNGRPGPKQADLSSLFDHEVIMKRSCDLNLKLMKWRLWPSLDTELLSNTKCLLIGAGTLGCSVARTLLGYHISYICYFYI
jgi:ubiquitin-like modifier-activating enzyme ATG7